MKDDSPASRTALMIAAYRGRASAREDAVCHDPWAARLSAEEGFELMAQCDRAFPHCELWVAVRTAFIDGQVERLLDDGVRQVVMLGAGFDTRAARLARPGVRFFEVDHPSSQADKQRRLGRLDGYPVAAASYVSCDFERQDFIERLESAGLDLGAPALLVWEGVTPYLTEGAVRGTLARVATACHPQTVLIFDYVMRRYAEGRDLDAADAQTHSMVADLGEPFRFGLNDPVPPLAEAGFRHVRTVSFDEACLGFTGTYERERKFRFQSVALASVARRFAT